MHPNHQPLAPAQALGLGQPACLAQGKMALEIAWVSSAAAAPDAADGRVIGDAMGLVLAEAFAKAPAFTRLPSDFLKPCRQTAPQSQTFLAPARNCNIGNTLST